MPGPTAPSPEKLAHVVIRTARFEELLEWWTTVLAARVVHRADHLAFVTYDDEHHRLAFLRNPEVGDDARSHAGLEHIAFTYATLDDLVATYERLRDLGTVPILPINHGMTLSLYYEDPDGNQAELQIDLTTVDQAADFMASDTFAANPFGVVFDPEEMAAQHRAGEPVQAIAAYGPSA